MANLSDDFVVELTDLNLDISRFEPSVRRKVLTHLRILQDDLVRKIQLFDLEGIPQDSIRRRRTESLIRSVNNTINLRYRQSSDRLIRELRELGVMNHDATVQIINRVFTVDIVKVTLGLADLKTIIKTETILGVPAADWWSTQKSSTRRKFAQEMRLGTTAGETNKQLIQRIRGKATGKFVVLDFPDGKKRRVREFANGIMETSMNQARSLVRTSVQSVSNESMFRTYEENKDILRGLEAITTLDGRTTHICMARTGSAWTVDGDPFPESSTQEPFPGIPPWHFQCRTMLGPVTKSWEDLIEESSGEKLSLLHKIPEKTRASMDGLVSSKIKTFDDFLRKKGDTFARKKLGPGRFDLWKKGKLTTPQLINQSGRPLSLQEIRQRRGL